MREHDHDHTDLTTLGIPPHKDPAHQVLRARCNVDLARDYFARCRSGEGGWAGICEAEARGMRHLERALAILPAPHWTATDRAALDAQLDEAAAVAMSHVEWLRAPRIPTPTELVMVQADTDPQTGARAVAYVHATPSARCGRSVGRPCLRRCRGELGAIHAQGIEALCEMLDPAQGDEEGVAAILAHAGLSATRRQVRLVVRVWARVRGLHLGAREAGSPSGRPRKEAARKLALAFCALELEAHGKITAAALAQIGADAGLSRPIMLTVRREALAAHTTTTNTEGATP
jgi:hypothetical protein